MKRLLVLFVCAAVALAVTPELEARFSAWARVHGKTYASAEERARRMEIFEQNVAEIDRLRNEPRDVDTTFAPTQFADLTHEEFRTMYLRPMSKTTKEAIMASSTVVRPVRSNMYVPDSFDWRDKGVVSEVKNQGACGSCWAFGAVASMEGAWALNGPKKELIDLSPQNLVDCDHECQVFPGGTTPECDQGCSGGMEPNAFNYVIKAKGIMAEVDYPYKARASTCRFDVSRVAARIANWTYVVCDEEALREYVYTHGPVSIGAYADTWSWYSGGIFDGSCRLENDHAILLVGWGEEAGKPYWIIKNSWGKSWGEKGYMRLIRGKNKCGILEMMSLPVV